MPESTQSYPQGPGVPTGPIAPPIGGLGSDQKPNIPPAPSSWDDDKRAIAQVFAMIATGDEAGGREHWTLYRKLKKWL